MSNTFATRATDTIWPPALSSTEGFGNPVTQISVTNSAAETALPTLSGKKQWILTVQNISTSANPAFVAFKTGSNAATVTSTTGFEIAANSSKDFFINNSLVNYIETISAGTATLKLYISSPGE